MVFVSFSGIFETSPKPSFGIYPENGRDFPPYDNLPLALLRAGQVIWADVDLETLCPPLTGEANVRTVWISEGEMVLMLDRSQ